MTVFSISRGRFEVRVDEYRGEASLSITFNISRKGPTWHLRMPDVQLLRQALDLAIPHLKRLEAELDAKKDGAP